MQKKTFQILFISLFLFSCEKEQEKTKSEEPDYQGAIVTFEKVMTIYSEEAKLKIKLNAPLQEMYNNGNVIYSKGLEITMYNEDGIRTTTMKGDFGMYQKDIRSYCSAGKVEVENVLLSQKLFTEEITWDQNRRQFITDKPIKIVTPNEILYGIGMTSNQDFSVYRIDKPTGIFTLK